MAFSFDSTISGPDSNSYVTIEDADDYFGGTVNETLWNSVPLLTKQQLLVMGSTRLESEQFGGYPSFTTQALLWPRLSVITNYADSYRNANGYYPDVMFYDGNTMPTQLQYATFELSLYFLNKANNALGTVSEIDLEQLEAWAVGPINTKIKGGFKVEQLPSKVSRMLTIIGPNAWMGGQQLSAIRG